MAGIALCALMLVVVLTMLGIIEPDIFARRSDPDKLVSRAEHADQSDKRNRRTSQLMRDDYRRRFQSRLLPSGPAS